jgi:hypothetical protein
MPEPKSLTISGNRPISSSRYGLIEYTTPTLISSSLNRSSSLLRSDPRLSTKPKH